MHQVSSKILSPLQKAEIRKVAVGWFEYSDRHRTEYQLDSFQYVDAEKIRTAFLERLSEYAKAVIEEEERAKGEQKELEQGDQAMAQGVGG